MISVGQFRELIIRPACETLKLHSEAAEELLLGTALQESNLTYLTQLGGGPALGVFQMERATHDDIWKNYLAYRPELAEKVRSICSIQIPFMMVGNLWYAAAMTRIHYHRVPEKLPDAGDYRAQAEYWKKYYNTEQGHGTAEQYIGRWEKHCL